MADNVILQQQLRREEERLNRLAIQRHREQQRLNATEVERLENRIKELEHTHAVKARRNVRRDWHMRWRCMACRNSKTQKVGRWMCPVCGYEMTNC